MLREYKIAKVIKHILFEGKDYKQKNNLYHAVFVQYNNVIKCLFLCFNISMINIHLYELNPIIFLNLSNR